MKTMEDYAREYQRENCSKGKVKEVTDYSFTFEKNPAKEGKVENVVVYLSYFWQMNYS